MTAKEIDQLLEEAGGNLPQNLAQICWAINWHVEKPEVQERYLQKSTIPECVVKWNQLKKERD